MNSGIFFKALLIAVVSFALAGVCYHFSPDFLHTFQPKLSWISYLDKSVFSSSKEQFFQDVNAIVIKSENGNIHIRPSHRENDQVKLITPLDSHEQAEIVNQNHVLIIKVQNQSIMLRIPP